MSDEIDQLKQVFEARCRSEFVLVASKSGSSQRVHLSVYENHSRKRSFGVELSHADRINIWVTFQFLHPLPPLPDSIVQTHKVWNKTKQGWEDKDPDPARKDRDGANSNLKSYDQFRGKSIVRLGVQSLEDLELVLGHLSS